MRSERVQLLRDVFDLASLLVLLVGLAALAAAMGM